MQATEPLVKEILGPILEQYQPAGIASLKMDRFHIGKVPPLIDGKIFLGPVYSGLMCT